MKVRVLFRLRAQSVWEIQKPFIQLPWPNSSEIFNLMYVTTNRNDKNNQCNILPECMICQNLHKAVLHCTAQSSKLLLWWSFAPISSISVFSHLHALPFVLGKPGGRYIYTSSFRLPWRKAFFISNCHRVQSKLIGTRWSK